MFFFVLILNYYNAVHQMEVNLYALTQKGAQDRLLDEKKQFAKQNVQYGCVFVIKTLKLHTHTYMHAHARAHTHAHSLTFICTQEKIWRNTHETVTKPFSRNPSSPMERPPSSITRVLGWLWRVLSGAPCALTTEVPPASQNSQAGAHQLVVGTTSSPGNAPSHGLPLPGPHNAPPRGPAGRRVITEFQ